MNVRDKRPQGMTTAHSALRPSEIPADSLVTSDLRGEEKRLAKLAAWSQFDHFVH